MTREEYEGRVTERRVEAKRLRAEGLSYREIAHALEVSKPAVIAMLKHDKTISS
jgi:predicted transcriptional regulator